MTFVSHPPSLTDGQTNWQMKLPQSPPTIEDSLTQHASSACLDLAPAATKVPSLEILLTELGNQTPTVSVLNAATF